MGLYTEQGVVARREKSPDHLINEIREAATKRHTALLADPPTDGTAKPDQIFSGIGWDWNTLLRNRPLDVWMHEQDVRRAVGCPAGWTLRLPSTPPATSPRAWGIVLAKRVGATAGTTVVLEVAGTRRTRSRWPRTAAASGSTDVPADPTVSLQTDRESFIVLAGGRRTPEPGAVSVTGDADLGQRILDSLAVTP